jgi:hypothetical protein
MPVDEEDVFLLLVELERWGQTWAGSDLAHAVERAAPRYGMKVGLERVHDVGYEIHRVDRPTSRGES